MPWHRAARTLAVTIALATAGSAAAQAKSSVPLPPPPTRAVAEESDGQRAMGGWAMVVFNTQPFEFPNTGGAPPLPLTVYTIGVRHWTTQPLAGFRNWGFDLGVGLAFSRSSVTQPQTGTLVTSDGPKVSGFGLHAGLPLAVAHHRHVTFELVPEVDLIWAGETLPPQTAGGDTTKYSGWSLRFGARAGFEVFFGFIGIPQLAIEASLGAAVTYDSVSSVTGPIERSSRTWGVATLRGTEPWSIFTGSVAAMYHF
jgi:hypothetical protein